jgi:hypothetical protein
VLYITLASQQDDQREQLRHTSSTRESGGFKALFSFTSPGSLFPPSAIISLTDDNSTFFLARPAAFGPSLPKDGLSSPLWIGSGFGDDSLGKGELGCGDSLDWVRHDNGFEQAPSVTPMNDPQGDPGVENGDASTKAPEMHATGATSNSADKHSNSRATTSSYSKKTTGHADIQSLQESAEIEGKVVLLKRGTCGFQQKVLWAQERGAVAVIVGDNVRGGGLILPPTFCRPYHPAVQSTVGSLVRLQTQMVKRAWLAEQIRFPLLVSCQAILSHRSHLLKRATKETTGLGPYSLLSIVTIKDLVLLKPAFRAPRAVIASPPRLAMLLMMSYLEAENIWVRLLPTASKRRGGTSGFNLTRSVSQTLKQMVPLAEMSPPLQMPIRTRSRHHRTGPHLMKAYG